MPRQLTFDLPVRPALGREDFFVSPSNAEAVAMIDAPTLWPGRKLLLIGPEGAGKSHLAEVFAQERRAMIVAGGDLFYLFDIEKLPDAVVVEDAEKVAGRHEETLFHLHNRMAETGGLLLLTAGGAPGEWGLRLPDLLSRMQGTAVAKLNPPDDALLGAVLVKLFADRQISVAPTLIDWLLPRMDRSFAAARRLVAELDARALAKGGAVTRALAAEVLDSARPDAP
ncbi:chromosomal replication initiator DnaA [Defluviimonas sp. SAOS-178_SWC]|uniref:chromosomal replication initiator DnaA n=1 Tax=Defluviimonas sp. SAOS-178_SWC TaxID=3121287 RepID=UPI003221CED8